MMSTMKTRLLGAGLALALAVGGTAALADGSSDGVADVMYSGPIEAASSASITVQGVALSIGASTQIFGLDSSNLVTTLTPADLAVGAAVTVYGHDEDGTPWADVIFSGTGFRIQGTVTALQTDSSGNAQAVLDGIYTINIGGVTYEDRKTEDTSGVQVGNDVVFWGIVQTDVFVAVFGKIEGGGEPAMDNGFILNLATDTSGNVTGFTMTSRGTSATVVLGPSTRIIQKNQDTTAAALKAGQHVKVWGTTQSDGSVLASEVIIKGGERS